MELDTKILFIVGFIDIRHGYNLWPSLYILILLGVLGVHCTVL